MSPSMVMGATAGAASRLAATAMTETRLLMRATMGMVTRWAASATARARTMISGSPVRPIKV